MRVEERREEEGKDGMWLSKRVGVQIACGGLGGGEESKTGR